MKVLIDTDMFCKLAAGRMLEDAVHLLGIGLDECGRPAALPYMLRRGRLRSLYGGEVCEDLMPFAEAIPVLIQPSEEWLGKLVSIDAIDPGEAQIFASAAEHGTYVMSGDKRALRALKGVGEFPNLLANRILVLEAILGALCEMLGPDEVRRRLEPLATLDQTIKICFSNPGTDPIRGLRSYFDHLATEVAPLVLWSPWSGGEA